MCIYCLAPLVADAAVQRRACGLLARTMGIDRRLRDDVAKRARGVHAHRALCAALQLHAADPVTADAIAAAVAALLDSDSLQKDAAPALAAALAAMGQHLAESATGSQALARLATHMAASRNARAATAAAGSVRAVFAQATTFANDPETLCVAFTAIAAFLRSSSVETREQACRLGTDTLVRTAVSALKRLQPRSPPAVVHALRLICAVLETIVGSEKECFDNGAAAAGRSGVRDTP